MSRAILSYLIPRLTALRPLRVLSRPIPSALPLGSLHAPLAAARSEDASSSRSLPASTPRSPCFRLGARPWQCPRLPRRGRHAASTSGRVREPPRGGQTRGGRCLEARRRRPVVPRARPRRRTRGSSRPGQRRRRCPRKRRHDHRPLPSRDVLVLAPEQHRGQRGNSRVACRAQSSREAGEGRK